MYLAAFELRGQDPVVEAGVGVAQPGGECDTGFIAEEEGGRRGNDTSLRKRENSLPFFKRPR